MDIVGLSRRQDKTERPSPGVASGVLFGGETTTRSAKRLGFLKPFFTDGTMMCSDYCAVNHINGGISLHDFSQRFKHRVEHARHTRHR